MGRHYLSFVIDKVLSVLIYPTFCNLWGAFLGEVNGRLFN
jgi:hypothetical protein